MKEFNVAILGATGAVGTRMIQQLEQSTIPVKSVKLLASARSAGKVLQFRGQDVTVEETTPDSFNGIDLVLSSAGGSTSKKFLPEAVKRGAVCVDNTSAYRMEKEVPLVIPEVNEKALYNHRGIIANPNCSTIQMVVCLEPIYKQFGLKQVIVSTYQAVSGAGQSALNELMEESQQVLNGEPTDPKILPTKGDKKHYQMAFNLLPQIDVFESDGYYTHEEWKMIHETKKIMLDDMDAKDIKVTATCVRSLFESRMANRFTLKLLTRLPQLIKSRLQWPMLMGLFSKMTRLIKSIHSRLKQKASAKRLLAEFVRTTKTKVHSICGLFQITS